MPEIIQTYQFNQLDPEGLYQDCLSTLKEIGAQDIREKIGTDQGQVKEASGTVPSIWGWGGMNVGFKVYQRDAGTNVDLTGYIAQLSTTPLTKTMDQFLATLAGKLQTRVQYTFQYQKLTRFIPAFKLHFTKTDQWAFIIIIVATLLTTLAGALFGHGMELFLSTLALGLGYYIGKKYLLKKS